MKLTKQKLADMIYIYLYCSSPRLARTSDISFALVVGLLARAGFITQNGSKAEALELDALFSIRFSFPKSSLSLRYVNWPYGNYS